MAQYGGGPQQYRAPNYGGGAPPQQPAGYPQPGGYPQQQQQPPPGQYGQQPPPQVQPGYSAPQGYAPPNPYQVGPGAPGGYDPTLKAWFDAVDQDRSGSIDYRELQAALSNGGFTFSATTAEKLVRMFDKTGSNSVNFLEFQEMHRFVNAMVSGFKQRDTSGDGTLDAAEVRSALEASGYRLNEQTFQLMMRKFDSEHRGALKLDDYIELSIMIGTATKVFSFYDRQRSGQVTFNFDSFFTAALSLR